MSEPALSRAPGRLAPYRIVIWILLLLACFGVLAYVTHAWRVVHVLSQGGTHQHALHVMLAWDIAYLAAACLTVFLTAGALLRREWARRGLRVLAAVLALWSLLMAIGMITRLVDFQHMAGAVLARPGSGDSIRAQLQHMRYALVISAGLECLAVPVLAWLWWQLGRPQLRASFRTRRGLFRH